MSIMKENTIEEVSEGQALSDLEEEVSEGQALKIWKKMLEIWKKI